MTQTNWTSLGKPTVTIKSSPSVGQNTGGRLEVFTIGSDGTLWHIWQTIAGKSWSNWNPLNKPLNTNVLVMPGVGKNADGRLEVFTVGTDGALWHIYQVAPNGTWSSWTPQGKPPNLNAVNAPIVAQNADGRLEAFTVGADGALWHVWQTTPNGTWSNWASLGLPAGASITSPPTVGKNKDGHLEVLVSGHDGALWHIWQTVPGNGWGNWDSLGTPPNIAINPSPFVSKNDDGRLEAFVNGSDGTLWHCWQVAPGGPWGSSTIPIVAATATVTITPMSKLLSNTFVITAVTGTPDPAQRQVQARILTATSPTQSQTVTSTGSIPGTRATGVLTFLNNTASAKSFGSVILRSASGVPVSFNGPVTVPANPGFLTITGFAVNVGSAGNIPALDINGDCCAQGIFVKNTAFSGGQDPQPNSIVQQSDIDGAANTLTASLTPGTQAALQGQVQPREQVVPNTPACQKSTFTANHAPGDHAPNVTVNVAITCREEVYDQQSSLAMAQNLLTQQAVNELGPNYMLIGSIESSVSQITVVDIHGTVSLLVQAQGTWVYRFSAADQQ